MTQEKNDVIKPNRPHRPNRRRRLRDNSIYLLPNAFTLAALFAAFYAITQSMHGHYEVAALRYLFLCCWTAWTGGLPV